MYPARSLVLAIHSFAYSWNRERKHAANAAHRAHRQTHGRMVVGYRGEGERKRRGLEGLAYWQYLTPLMNNRVIDVAQDKASAQLIG